MVAGSSTIFPASSKNQIQQVEKIIKHPDQGVDLAILVLKKGFIFSKNVNKISLKTRGHAQGDLLWDCITYGWGKKSKNGVYELSGTKLTMTKLSNRTHCYKSHPKAREVLKKRLDLICGKTPEDFSICSGDFGGPLLCSYHIGTTFQIYFMGTAIKLTGDYDCRKNRKKEAVYEPMQDRLELNFIGHMRWLKKTMDALQKPNVERSSSKMGQPISFLRAILFSATIAAVISE